MKGVLLAIFMALVFVLPASAALSCSGGTCPVVQRAATTPTKAIKRVVRVRPIRWFIKH
jgi:hypothetical protein